MRGAVVLLLLLLGAAGVYLASQWSGPGPGIEPGDAPPGATTNLPTDVGPPPDPLAADRQPRPGGISRPETGEPASAPRRLVPVTILARSEDSDGTGSALSGFTARLTDRTGRELPLPPNMDSGHVLELGPGAYTLGLELPGFVPPAAAEFQITAASEPITLRFPFRKVEAVLLLEVLDRSTRQRLADFRVSIELSAPGGPKREQYIATPRSNPLPILAGHGETVVVRVEAKGYSPAEPLRVDFSETAATVERKVFLAAGMKFTGVELQVVDESNQPVPRLLVAVQMRGKDGEYAALWRRRAARADGNYRLPDLAPGSYRMQLRGIDEHGIPTLHLVHEFGFEFTGAEHIRESIVLRSGASIELRLADLGGNRIGKDVALRLTHPDGKVKESVWRPLVDGKPAAADQRSADHLLQDAPARLDDAVPAGAYTLTLRWGTGPEVVRNLVLASGETTVVEAQLTRQ